VITLFDYLPSQNAYKIRLLLSHLKQPYKSKMISIFEGEGKTEEFRSINPTGAVPAIQLENGEIVAESNAILTYLADGTEFLPKGRLARAKVFQWLFFEGETVQGGVATLRHWVQTGKDKNRSADILEAKRSLSLKALDILDRELGDNIFLGGDRYTIADIAVFAYMHLANEANLPLQNYVNVTRWIERVRSQEGFLPEVHPYSIDPHSVEEL
jgi:glutathione S-transferase